MSGAAALPRHLAQTCRLALALAALWRGALAARSGNAGRVYRAWQGVLAGLSDEIAASQDASWAAPLPHLFASLAEVNGLLAEDDG